MLLMFDEFVWNMTWNQRFSRLGVGRERSVVWILSSLAFWSGEKCGLDRNNKDVPSSSISFRHQGDSYLCFTNPLLKSKCYFCKSTSKWTGFMIIQLFRVSRIRAEHIGVSFARPDATFSITHQLRCRVF